MEVERQTASPSVAKSAEDPSVRIVDLIADLEGVAPVDVSPPLYSVIDPEALDTLFHPPTNETSHSVGYVEFEYNGYDIRVQSDGGITILDH